MNGCQPAVPDVEIVVPALSLGVTQAPRYPVARPWANRCLAGWSRQSAAS